MSEIPKTNEENWFEEGTLPSSKKRIIDLGDGKYIETNLKEFKSDEQIEKAEAVLDRIDHMLEMVNMYSKEEIERLKYIKAKIEDNPGEFTDDIRKEVVDIFYRENMPDKNTDSLIKKVNKMADVAEKGDKDVLEEARKNVIETYNKQTKKNLNQEAKEKAIEDIEGSPELGGNIGRIDEQMAEQFINSYAEKLKEREYAHIIGESWRKMTEKEHQEFAESVGFDYDKDDPKKIKEVRKKFAEDMERKRVKLERRFKSEKVDFSREAYYSMIDNGLEINDLLLKEKNIDGNIYLEKKVIDDIRKIAKELSEEFDLKIKKEAEELFDNRAKEGVKKFNKKKNEKARELVKDAIKEEWVKKALTKLGKYLGRPVTEKDLLGKDERYGNFIDKIAGKNAKEKDKKAIKKYLEEKYDVLTLSDDEDLLELEDLYTEPESDGEEIGDLVKIERDFKKDFENNTIGYTIQTKRAKGAPFMGEKTVYQGVEPYEMFGNGLRGVEPAGPEIPSYIWEDYGDAIIVSYPREKIIEEDVEETEIKKGFFGREKLKKKIVKKGRKVPEILKDYGVVGEDENEPAWKLSIQYNNDNSKFSDQRGISTFINILMKKSLAEKVVDFIKKDPKNIWDFISFAMPDILIVSPAKMKTENGKIANKIVVLQANSEQEVQNIKYRSEKFKPEVIE